MKQQIVRVALCLGALGCASSDLTAPPELSIAADVASAVEAPTAGLLAHYPLDGSVAMGEGTAGDGTWNGALSATSDRFGNAGGALAFDGSTNWGVFPSTLASDPTRGTISVWVRRAAGDDATRCGRPEFSGIEPFACQHNIFAKSVGGETPEFRAQFSGDLHIVDRFYLQASGAIAQSAPQTGQFGAWTHLAFTWNETDLVTYMNGVEVSRAAVVAPTSLDGAFYLGHNSHASFGTRERFEGAMDDLRVYRRALGPDAISRLAREGAMPTTVAECRNGGWREFGFESRRECRRYVRGLGV